MLKYLPDTGFFIEAGAYDGLYASNTYFFERIMKWKGLLIEPVPKYYKQCKKNRRNSIVLNYALVSRDYKKSTVQITENRDKSFINSETDINSKNYLVKASTLSDLIRMIDEPKINLLSLDAEGYELEILKGLDFDIHSPDYILLN